MTWQKTVSNSSGFSTTVVENDGSATMQQRMLVGTAATGLVRIEWVQARYGQIIPTNWSWVQMWQYLNCFIPLRYQVDDAQNLIVAHAVHGEYDWLLLYEHDVLPPPDALVRLAAYMKDGTVPVVSGLYFTRSIPSEPLVYRGRGTLSYDKFEIGDKIWVDGVPTGFLLISMKLIKLMWEDAEPYLIGNQLTRRVFETPNKAWFDPESGQYNTISGTSDLAWCDRVIAGNYLEKAGFSKVAAAPYPFLIDTDITCSHINMDGQQFPPGGVRQYWQSRLLAPSPDSPPDLGVSVSDGLELESEFGG